MPAPYLRDGSWLHQGTIHDPKEQPMFLASHPDIMGQLASERAAGFRAAAARHRVQRPTLAGWRPARFVQPSADLSRVVPGPAPHVATSKPGRAA